MNKFKLFLPICLLGAGVAFAEVTFDSSYECGNATGFVETAPNEWSFELEADSNSDDRQWFDFTVAGAKGQTLMFKITNAGAANVRGHWNHANPVTSTDGGTSWTLARVTDDYSGNVYSFTIPIESDPQRIAFHYPYSFSYHQKRMEVWKKNSNTTHRVIGKTVQGRDLDLLQITNKESAEKKMGLWITARQHAAEVTGSYMVDGFIDFLQSDDERAVKMRNRMIFNIVPMSNPDGVVIGNYRDNAMGMNLNRSWMDATLEKDPEIVHVKKAIQEWIDAGNDYTFYADLHSTSGGTSNFAFHAAPGIEPEHYPEPAMYAAHSDKLLQLVQNHCTDFTMDEGNSSSPDPRLSRQNQMNEHGILAVLFEGTYNYTSYGDNKGQYMTPKRHRKIGEAFAIALYEYYLKENHQ